MDKEAQQTKAAAQPKPEVKKLDPDAFYLVEVNRPLRLGKDGDTVLTRSTDNRIRGRMLQQILDDSDMKTAVVKHTLVR